MTEILASTVDIAFREFLEHKVRLDSIVSTKARGSRDWLIGQLHALADGTTNLPDPYEDMTYPFGSFARRTKIRELDDIDLIMALKAQGATYSGLGSTYTISVPETAKNLRPLCNDGSDILNSRKVINRIVKELNRIPQYSRADVKRNGAAAVLDLSSYTWVFDIVPAFFTTQEADGRNYYLIPDGNGSWMKTDPRIDQSNVTSANQDNGGHLLDLIRLVKYWNRRQTMPSVGSYLLECFVIKFVKQRVIALTEYPDLNFTDFLEFFRSAIYGQVDDPKGIDGNINSIDLIDQIKIGSVAIRDHERAIHARTLESALDHKGAISKWQEIFGDDFPSYP